MQHIKNHGFGLLFALALFIGVLVSAQPALAWNGTGTEEDPYQIATAEDLNTFADIVNRTDGQTQNTDDSAVLVDDVVYEGSGTEEDPYQIPNLATLEYYRDLINGNTTNDEYGNKHYVLTADIDLGGEENEWTPIGTVLRPFTGTFDGQSHSITGLYINDSNTGYKGFFGYFGSAGTGTVTNLSVAGEITGGRYVGGIAGYNWGTVSNCTSTVDISVSALTATVGGVVGDNDSYGTVINCANYGDCSATGNSAYVGGVVGENSGTVRNCYNGETGSVTGNRYAGGVVGRNYQGSDQSRPANLLSGCYNTGKIHVNLTSSTGDGYAGGVAGWNDGGTVSSCYSIGTITAATEGSKNAFAAGVVGRNSETSGTVNGAYYLEADGLPDIGSNEEGTVTNVAPKDAEAFASGEVAWLLQDAVGEDAGQVWGQQLSGESKDAYPVLTQDTGKAVYQVTFDYNYEGAEDTVLYTNGTVALPEVPIRDGYVFTGWSGYTEGMMVTADTVFIAQWRARSVDTDVSSVTVKGEPAALNGATFSVTLPAGSSLPTADEIQITVANGASVTSGPTTNDGGVIWTFTVTAEDGITTAQYIIQVTIAAPDPTPIPDPEPETPLVTTDDNTGTTETTAKPDVTMSGGTASATVSDEMGEEIVNQATENNSQTVIIAPEMDADTTSTEVTLPAATIDSIGTDTNADIVISTPVADVTLPNGGLSDLASAGGNITVSASVQGNTVALSVTADGEPVSSVTGGVTLVVPASDTTAGTVAVIVHDDGTREVVRKSVAADDSVTIPLSGSATVEIIDNSKDFDDVSVDAWYSDVVDFASSHELFNGTSETTFSPNDGMTRGMLAAVLANLESADISGMESAFNDVHDDAWYSESVAWAAENGIVNGYGDGTFGPDDVLTREQFAAMLYNYANMLGLDVSARATLDAYTDAPSAWAEDVVSWAVAEGLIAGVTDDQLQPQGTATRAQVAAMLQRFIENVL